MVIEEIAQRLSVRERDWKVKDRARQVHVRSRDIVLVEPQSFMNESGVPTRLVASWYRVAAERTLVVYDELDLPFGRLRMRERGSSAGHNGMKSVIAYFGQEIPRLRIGIGRDDSGAIDRVLSRFTAAERKALPRVLAAAADAALLWAERGFTAAANLANAWRLDEGESNRTAPVSR
jgi:PTH1 family peptidyl-tRNA hydrolase